MLPIVDELAKLRQAELLAEAHAFRQADAVGRTRPRCHPRARTKLGFPTTKSRKAALPPCPLAGPV